MQIKRVYSKHATVPSIGLQLGIEICRWGELAPYRHRAGSGGLCVCVGGGMQQHRI